MPPPSDLTSNVPRPVPLQSDLTSNVPPVQRLCRLIPRLICPKPVPLPADLTSDVPRPVPLTSDLTSNVPRPVPRMSDLTSNVPRPVPLMSDPTSNVPQASASAVDRHAWNGGNTHRPRGRREGFSGKQFYFPYTFIHPNFAPQLLTEWCEGGEGG